MKKFIGTKEVMAEPMILYDAVLKGWARKELLLNGKRVDGYHVRYINPDGSFYDSWSPKYVFEAAYKKADDFKDRLLVEYDELASRIKKLKDFKKGGLRKKVGLGNALLMYIQIFGMAIYFSILMVRMDNLNISYKKPWKDGK